MNSEVVFGFFKDPKQPKGWGSILIKGDQALAKKVHSHDRQAIPWFNMYAVQYRNRAHALKYRDLAARELSRINSDSVA
jgi:hypothetical protein